jgi:predicted Rossmann fold nucleotide-binding protein DprA/Smf involved in DNA uptake
MPDIGLTERLRTLQKALPARQAAASGPSGTPPAPLSGEAQKALAQLGHKPVGLQDITQRSGLTPAEVMAALTELELAGLSRQLAGRQFVVADGK